MRIGYFTERYLPQTDGVVYSVEIFRRELEKLGHEVYIFAPSPSLRYKEKDPRIIRFPAVKGLWFEDYMTKFPWTPQSYRRAKQLSLDIVHLHTPSEMGIFAISMALKENLPMVATHHTDLVEYVKHYPKVLPGALILSQLLPVLIGRPELFRSSLPVIKPEKTVDEWNQKIIIRLLPMLYNYCRLVIAPSPKVRKQLLTWKTTVPIEVLPTGIDKITTESGNTASEKENFNLSDDDRVVLYVGRLGAEKNIELLIRAFAVLNKKMPQLKLLLVGDHPSKNKLLGLAKSLGVSDKIIITGYIERDRLGIIYELAEVFAFPSLTDTQGLVLHEAAAAGLPVVMVDHEITEVIQDGINGYYADNDPQDMADKIYKILDNPPLRAKMSAAGQKLAAKHTASQQTAKLLRLYQKVIRDHQRAQGQKKTSPQAPDQI